VNAASNTSGERVELNELDACVKRPLNGASVSTISAYGPLRVWMPPVRSMSSRRDRRQLAREVGRVRVAAVHEAARAVRRPARGREWIRQEHGGGADGRAERQLVVAVAGEVLHAEELARLGVDERLPIPVGRAGRHQPDALRQARRALRVVDHEVGLVELQPALGRRCSSTRARAASAVTTGVTSGSETAFAPFITKVTRFFRLSATVVSEPYTGRPR
jgi:hypothetical protein